MNNMRFSDGDIIVKRISKRTARKMFNNGKRVMFCPVNCNPLHPYYSFGVWCDKSFGESFDSQCTTYQFYNCNGELGRYIAFYAEL